MGKWKGVALTGKRQSVLSALAPQNGKASTSEVRVADVSELPCAHGVSIAATKTLYLTASLQASRADACDAAAALFAWRHGCTIEDEYGERIDSDAKLRRVVESWEAQDELRKRDALTAHLERARTQLLARSRPDLHIRGLHLTEHLTVGVLEGVSLVLEEHLGDLLGLVTHPIAIFIRLCVVIVSLNMPQSAPPLKSSVISVSKTTSPSNGAVSNAPRSKHTSTKRRRKSSADVVGPCSLSWFSNLFRATLLELLLCSNPIPASQMRPENTNG